ncbi:MAG TPA: DUF3108 domain-containing protein [Pyrinomonadaceae bacterium]|nr:DUF3108 domain-containing protein [Pyrinomonadaceae bacterium]
MYRRENLRQAFTTAVLFLLCLVVVGIGVGTRAQVRNDVNASPFNAAPYRVGERLTYTVSFSNFPTAAHVELLVSGRGPFHGREGIELRAHVETIGVVSAALYSINNEYVTHVDPATGLPYRAQQIIREAARTDSVTLDFNTVASGPSPSNPSAQAHFTTVGSYDFLAAIYRLRALPLTQGTTYAIPVQNGSALYNAELRVTGTELVKTNIGSSATLVTQVRVRGDEAADDYRVHIYFTNDERHLPVLITARHRAGEIRAELASSEMLNIPGATVEGLGTPAVPAQPGMTLPPAVTPGAPAPTASATPPAPPRGAEPLPALPFEPGEQLNFNFFLGPNPQPIGTASFQVRPRARYFNREGLLLTAVLQTAGAGQRLFPVNDQINSYVDARALLPFRTELNLQEGQRLARWIVSSDQNGGSALFDDGTRLEIPVATHDLVSVFYALRSFDLTPPRRNSVSLLVNKRPRLLHVTSLRRDTLALGGQRIPAVELSLATADPDGDRFQLRLWVSTDRRRLPLRLTAQTPLGPVRADLAIIPTSLQ